MREEKTVRGDPQSTVAAVDHHSTGDSPPDRDWVLGRNPAVRRVWEHALRAAEADCTVLVAGETGTGKEICARLLHRHGVRVGKPFVPVNCAALTSTLAESQLFGHERGAFTGALGGSLGVFRAAEGGIAFLDEIGEMPMDLQPKLLRVLQQCEVTPVGASQPISINVQFIAATNRNLDVEVANGRFREDLLYRLNMVELKVPPLRQRIDDGPDLIEFFSARFAAVHGGRRWRPDVATLRDVCEFAWPGNIRQLSQVIERSYVLGAQPCLPSSDSASTSHLDNSLPYFNLARLRDAAVRQALAVR